MKRLIYMLVYLLLVAGLLCLYGFKGASPRPNPTPGTPGTAAADDIYYGADQVMYGSDAVQY